MKPQNIIYNQTYGQIKIVDFGLPCIFTSVKRVQVQFLYLAPEILNGKPYDQMVDMWSLGIVFFILVTGSIPYLDQNPEKIVLEIKQGLWNEELLDKMSDYSSDMV